MGMRTTAAFRVFSGTGAGLFLRRGAPGRRLTIVSSIKPWTFKDYTRTASNKPGNFFMALGALFNGFIGYFLKYIKNLFAILAFVLISRHTFLLNL